MRFGSQQNLIETMAQRNQSVTGNQRSVLVAESPPPMRAKLIRADGTVEEVELSVPVGPPRFLRLPPPGALCPISGLSRSYLNELILPTPRNSFKPPVKSYVLRQRADCKTGVRLVDARSLFDYVERHPFTDKAA
jgi:hypothetical protein